MSSSDATTHAQAAAVERCTLLLVEDNVGDADLFREAVRESSRRSFEVLHATTLAKALAALEEQAVDLVAVDLNLPDSTGRATFDALRDVVPHVPMVVLTGQDDDALALGLIREGAQDYLVKGETAPHPVTRCLEYAIARKRIENELEESREAALAASRSKSAFVASMTHEIRTPLTAIIGMADLLSETDLDPEQQQYLEIFRRCGATLLGLLNNVLELTRLETDSTDPVCEEFELGELVADAVEMFAFVAHSKGLAVAFETARDVPSRVRSDPNRIRQVLSNLLGNAVKFTEAGEVVAGVSRETHAGEEYLRFEVTDTGMGIPEERRAAVFDRFVQADEEIHRKYGGSGLGLSICKELIEGMGGRVGVDSRVGEGSTFFFAVPLVEAEGAPDALSERDERLSARRVLLVDDHEAERRIMTTTLARCGARVTESESLKSALLLLEIAESEGRHFDVALLDCRMPGGGGFEVVRWLQRRPGLVGRSVMLLPMNHRVGDIRQCRELDAEPLAKPVRPSSLIRAVAGEDDTIESQARPPDAAGSLRGVRILLAEDTRDNRALILALLRPTECEVAVADNGATAVERYRTGDFDIVLTDMQMPVMDGLEATREIRRFEAETGRARTPVVALTAYAFREHEEACLEAGCDLRLTKPIDRKQLMETLHSLAGEPPPAVDVDPDIADLVPGYLENRREDPAELRAALAAGDFASIERIAHNMKGSGKAYGFPRLTEIGRELEGAAQRRDGGEIDRRVGELEGFLDRVALAPDAPAESSGE